MNKKNITIIGGDGAMGQLFKKLWHSFNVKILTKNDWDNAKALLKCADLVVVSVPIDITIQIIKDAAKFISKECILMDLTSIKKEPLETMLHCHSGSVIGLHPMFGPTIETPHNQIIINCGGRCVTDCSWVLESLTSIGFCLVEMPAAEHDKAMGFIQGIEHFSTFALGNFLKLFDLHPEKIFNIASPIYQTKLALLGRIFDQDPKLYADIIMADESRIELITKYIDYLQELKEMLLSKDKKKFIDSFTKISKWMGNFTAKSQASTDKFLTNIPSIYK